MKKLFKNNLQTKFILTTAFIIAFVFMALGLSLYVVQSSQVRDMSDERMAEQLDDMVKSLELTYHEKSQVLALGLEGALKYIEQKGGIQVSDSTYQVQVRHLRTQEIVEVTLPYWYLNGQQINYQNQELLDLVRSFTGGFATLFYYDNDAIITLTTNVKGTDGQLVPQLYIHLPTESLVKAAFDKGQAYRGRLDVLGTQSLVVYHPMPVTNGEGQLVIFVGIPEKNMQSLRNLFTQKTFYQTGYSYCFDGKGKYILHPKTDTEGGLVSLDSAQLADMKAAGKGSLRFDPDQTGETTWTYYEYYAPYDLFVAISVKESEFMDAPMNSIRNVIGMSFLLAMVVGLGGIYWQIRSITSPLAQLSAYLQTLAKGQFPQLTETDRHDEIGLMAQSVRELVDGQQKAADFAKEIGKGNYRADFTPLSQADVLGGALLHMRDNLATLSESETQRKWTAEGIARFSEMLRQHDQELDTVGKVVLTELVKHLKCNQGMLFVLDDEKELLELKATYAWAREKFLTKWIEPGEGLAGQAWLEKQPIYLKEIPKSYVRITSGLGQALPNCVMIVPLVARDKVEGVLEIASFHPLADHEREFAVRVCEMLASTMASMKLNLRTARLLEEARAHYE